MFKMQNKTIVTNSKDDIGIDRNETEEDSGLKDHNVEDEEDEEEESVGESALEESEAEDYDQEPGNDDDAPDGSLPEKQRKVHKLSMKKTEDFNETLKKRGVIYVARIPPRLTPTKLKTIFSEYGTVTRIFLQEEDAAVRKRRRKASGNTKGSGGSGRKRYVEGWVEFERKSVAKRVAAALHHQLMSNVKRNPHYGDLWSLKYLPKFQWSHLTEKVAYERRVREQKLRLETMQAKRETASYKKLLETGVKLDKIAERKRKRGDDDYQQRQQQSTGIQRTHSSYQVQPLDDGASRASKKALLGSLV